LGNDSDAEDSSLEAVNASQPSNGTVTLNADGTFVYIHNGTNSPSDSFTYQAKDSSGELSNIATVTLTINIPVNRPVAVDDSYSVNEASTITHDFAEGVLANDSDSETAKADLVVTLITAPSCATVEPFPLENDGSFAYTHNGNENCASDSFVYSVTNQNGESSEATVTLNITFTNNAPYFLPGHNGDSVNGSNEYEVLEFTLAGKKENSTGLLRTVRDDENDPLQLKIISGPKYGTLKLGGTTYTDTGDDSTLYSEDFRYDYDGKGPYNFGNGLDLTRCANGDPSTVFNGLTSSQIEAISNDESRVPFCFENKDTIRVIAVDSVDNESGESTINLFLNVQPVANDDSVTTAMNSAILIDAFANDYDRDGAIVPSRVTGLSCTSGT